ncbi:hypothetical protein [uncultured Cellulomonas sp.]|nr:hypothetical protein [uncultured Cellulomonas sp.]
MSMWISLVTFLSLLGALTVCLALVVRRDGLGHRPPPASRRDWFEQRP